MEDTTYSEIQISIKDELWFSKIEDLYYNRKKDPLKWKILKHCLCGLDCIDISKYKDLDFDIEELCPTRFKIEITDDCVVHGIKINNIDCTDFENI